MFAWLFAHRGAVLVFTILSTIACLFAARGITWREDVMDLLPKSDPLIAQYKQILTDFGTLNQMLVEVGPAAPRAVPAEGELVGAADRVADAMQRSGLFKQVVYRMDAADFSSALDILRARRASLFTADDAASLTQRIAPGTIREILAGWTRQLTEMPAPYVARLMARDPLGMDQLLLAKLAAAQSFDGPVRVEKGRLFSRDLAHILVMGEPNFPATDSFHSQALVEFMDRAAAQAEAPAAGRVRVAYLCGHRFSLENASRIKSDVKLTLIVSFLAIAAVSLLVYRRPLWVGLTFLPTFFGGAFAIGMLRVLAPDISAIAIGCGSMLLGIAVDLGVQVLYQSDQLTGEGSRRERMIALLDRLFWPLILCSATTIVAFFSLEWSVLPGYQSLGHFAALGFTGATIFAVLILPLLIPLRPRRPVRPPILPLASIFPPFFRWIARRRAFIIAALVVSLIAGLPGVCRLRFEGDYRRMNAVSARVRDDMERIVALFDSVMSSSSIVVRGGTLEASLRANEKVYTTLKELQARGVVASVMSIAPLLPSEATQQAGRARWSAFWNPDRTRQVRDALAQAAAGLRMSPGAFEPFFAALAAPPRPLVLGDLQTGLFRQLATLHAAPAAEGAPVLTNFTLAPGADIARVFGALDAAGIPYISFHGPRLMDHVIRLIQREMIRVGAITIVLVILILAAYYRRPRKLALMLLPLLAGLYWTFAIMGYCDMRVNLMNSLIVVFIFGVVVDYAIFLEAALSRAAGPADPFLSNSSAGILISAATTVIGLGVLAVASHPALHSIGMTSLLGILTGLAAVFAIIPLSRK